LHGRHVIVDAVGALYSTCRRALASPEDSSERAIARSALARRARRWGCTASPCEWLGSDAHVAAAVVMEKEMEAKGARPEAFDFFLLYTAWLEVQDRAIHKERVEEGREPSRRRPVMAVEHEERKWGEALMASEHSAWRNGTSKTLYDVLGVAAPASLVGVGITRVEHLCRPGDMGGGAFEFTPFAMLVKTWGLSSSHKVRVEWGKLVLELRERCLDTSPWFDEGMGNRVAVRPLSARQLWDGVRRLGGAWGVDAGWPLGEARVGHRRGNKFTGLLLQARSSGEDVSKASWREALVETYGTVERLPATEWRDGAPTDVDRYGSRIINVWPEADSRTGGGVRVYGGRSIETGIDEGREGREEEVREWSVDESGDLMIGSRMATLVDARGLPCVRLLMRSTARLKEEGAAVDTGHERTLRSAGVWAIHVESSRQILREWNGLYVEHDIQYAAATDGGRQVDDKGRHVASSAGVLDNGCVVGGALDPHKDARSSYETELQALIDVLEVWPDGSRVMIAVDARSPVQAIVRFREAHVNRRAEYFVDDKLDSLLRHLERMQTVVFYWLKGHSGAAPNEFADLHATKFLSEDVRR
jgi:ribonuclease HI